MTERVYTLEDWNNPEPWSEPFCVIEDDFYEDEDEDGTVYTGSTLYAYDGDGGRMVISADSQGHIFSLRLHECEFIGECDLELDDLLGWVEDLLFHIREMNTNDNILNSCP